MSAPPVIVAGPVLFARGADARRCRLAALLVTDAAGSVEGGHDASVPPPLYPDGGDAVAPSPLARVAGRVVWRYDFALPAAADAAYTLAGARHSVVTELAGALRVAYVSCNGREHGDVERDADERDAMWRRLREEHERAPFALLLHGGDQLYADEASGSHPALATWAESALEERAGFDFDAEAERAATRFFVERYVALYARSDAAALFARVPSLMMWDDHDIFDGWGSLAPEILGSACGRGLFGVARRAFLLFQRALATAPRAIDDPPPSVDGSVVPEAETGLAPRVAALPRASDGARQDAAASDVAALGEPVIGDAEPSLSWAVSFPGLAVIAPDLRSERRPERILGEAGWAVMERDLDASGDVAQRLLLSSVPLLGPRLSWIERVIHFVPRLRRYEDDLRDQWQSRAHREEWRRILLAVDGAACEGGAISVLSGEIHLATRGEMPLANGAVLHQLVASGIAHPPPPSLWGRALGALARLGEDPLPGRRIRLLPLPGRRGIYTVERNYLVLERDAGGGWRAAWECEESGRTAPLAL